MGAEHEYTENDVQEILRRAAAIEGSADISRRLMEQTAAEVGISPEALEQAELEFRRERRVKEEEAAFLAHRLRNFYQHLGTFLIVNLFLVALWWITGSRYPWFVWPLLGWGLAIVLDALRLTSNSGEAYERELAQWKSKQNPSDLQDA